MRKQVTSPGGATLAGLKVFESAGVRETMGAAVRAVHARAQELGRLRLEPGKEGSTRCWDDQWPSDLNDRVDLREP